MHQMNRNWLIYMSVFLLSVIRISIQHSEGDSEAVDYRRTVIKAGYGVNYDRVGSIISSGGTSYYTHTWSIGWPTLQFTPLAKFSCMRTVIWGERCNIINRIIMDTNHYVYTTIAHARQQLLFAHEMVPRSTNVTSTIVIDTVTDVTNYMTTSDMTTSNMTTSDTSTHEQTTPPSLWEIHNNDSYINETLHHHRRNRRSIDKFGQLHSMQQKSNNPISDWNPMHISGQVWSALTGKPGPQDIRLLRNHLEIMGTAFSFNTDAIQQYQQDISSFSNLLNNRFKDVANETALVSSTIRKLRVFITNIYNTGLTEEELMAKEITNSFHADDIFLTDIMPSLIRLRNTVRKARTIAVNWVSGIRTLTRGYLSPDLVPLKSVRDVIDHISGNILSQPRYSDLRMISASPWYYYTLKSLSYTRVFLESNDADSPSVLGVSLRIPLYRAGGLLPVYRIDTYPVPTHSGMDLPITGDRNTREETIAFTMIYNMPQFIAIAENQETYVEMSAAFYLSCEGGDNTKICGSGIPALKKSGIADTCAFGIFTEFLRVIRNKCDFRYVDTTKWKPYGSAIQMNADASFIIHSSHHGPNTDTWRLSCPEYRDRPGVVQMKICDMCRIRIPCFCTVTGADFFIPMRYTNCIVGKGRTYVSHLQYMYHLNKVVVTELYPRSDAASVASYEAKLNEMYPHFNVPNIKFTVDPSLTEFVDASNKFDTQYNRIIEAQKNETHLFDDRAQAALRRVRNFTDQTVDRSGDVSKALSDVIEGVFGSNIGAVIAAIFCPIGMSCIAFMISTFEFVPSVSLRLYRCIVNRRAEHTYQAVIEQYRYSKLKGKSIHEKRMRGQRYVDDCSSNSGEYECMDVEEASNAR